MNACCEPSGTGSGFETFARVCSNMISSKKCKHEDIVRRWNELTQNEKKAWEYLAHMHTNQLRSSRNLMHHGLLNENFVTHLY